LSCPGALLVAISALPAFIIFCLSRHMLIYATIGINVALVLAVLMRVLFISFEHFSKQVKSGSLSWPPSIRNCSA
jgi:predicted signal transduction protein with EAL and GGDEF domain